MSDSATPAASAAPDRDAGGAVHRLAGRRILVVGTGSQPLDDPDAPAGNGKAISVVAARQGATVVCADRDETAVAETVSRIESEASHAELVLGDVTKETDCAAIIAAAAAEPLDGLVLNVGTGLGRGLKHTTVNEWDVTFAVNLRSHFLLAKEALPHLTDGASIVFIGSLAGLQPGSMSPAYDSSKAALLGLCRHTALEGARRGVRANVVAPGLIDTPMGRRATEGRPSRGTTRVPLGRQGTAWEVADAVTFLLSSEASYITGQVLVVDGGLSLL